MKPPPLIGIDLLEPKRLQERLQRNTSLREELFSPAELSYAEAQALPHLHLAARLSAKEAVIKALGIDGWDPRDIEVTDGGENTGLYLMGEVADRAEELGVQVSISLTHLESIVGAVAIARPIAAA